MFHMCISSVICCNIAYLHARNMHVLLQLLWPVLFMYVLQFPRNKTMTINLVLSPKVHNNIKKIHRPPPKKQPPQYAKLFGINF